MEIGDETFCPRKIAQTITKIAIHSHDDLKSLACLQTQLHKAMSRVDLIEGSKLIESLHEVLGESTSVKVAPTVCSLDTKEEERFR